jgi:hypothetical protein
MRRSPLRSLSSLPRRLHRRSQALTGASSEHRFEPRLRVDPGAPELLLSPHWDDAVLDCWGLLSSARELQVLNLFAGVPPAGRAGVWEAVAGVRDSAERARGRIAEDALALSRAGRSALNLPMLDAKNRRRAPAGELGTLDEAVGAAVASASRVYVPAGIGGHADHLLARSYGRALLRAGMPVTLYAELPYCVFHGWPSWVDGGPAAANRDVDAYWQAFLDDVPEMPALRSAEITRLDRTSAAAKLAALGCYETSLNYAVRQMLADPAFHGFEVSWRLVTPGLDPRAH